MRWGRCFFWWAHGTFRGLCARRWFATTWPHGPTPARCWFHFFQRGWAAPNNWTELGLEHLPAFSPASGHLPPTFHQIHEAQDGFYLTWLDPCWNARSNRILGWWSGVGHMFGWKSWGAAICSPKRWGVMIQTFPVITNSHGQSPSQFPTLEQGLLIRKRHPKAFLTHKPSHGPHGGRHT